MITPFLFVKNRLISLRERIDDERIRVALVGVIFDLDSAIDQQADEDRAHREEVEALMGRK